METKYIFLNELEFDSIYRFSLNSENQKKNQKSKIFFTKKQHILLQIQKIL